DDQRHFTRLAKLLELERDAEARRAVEMSRKLSPAEAERSGTALVDMTIVDEEAGLGGRYILSLVKRSREKLPWTRLAAGRPVALSPQAADAKLSLRGVVNERTAAGISVAVASLPDELEDVERWRIDLSSDEISSQRQRAALDRAAHAQGDRLAELR